MSRRTVRLSLLVLLLGGTAVGGYAYRQHHRYKHVAVHREGMVYRSAWCEPEVMGELIERWQVRTVVNLCRRPTADDPTWEMGEDRWVAERAAVRDSGAELLELDMPLTVDPADPALRAHVAALSDPDNYPMLVHCQHGVTRTAKFLAMYDMVMDGKTAAESLDAQPLFGRDRHNVHVTAFAQQFETARAALYPETGPDALAVLRGGR